MPRIGITTDDLARKILELAQAGLESEIRSLLGATGAAGTASRPGGTTFVNPMDEVGELIRGGTGGAPLAIPAGTEGQILMMVGGVPTWVGQAALAGNVVDSGGNYVVDSAGNFVIAGGA